jgi:hypothetical protein
VDEPIVRADGEVKLIGSNGQHHEIPRPQLTAAYAAKVFGEEFRDLGSVIAAEAVIPPHAFLGHSERRDRDADAIEPFGIPSLRPESCADERACAPGVIGVHFDQAPG